MSASGFKNNPSAKAGLLLLIFIIVWVTYSLKLFSPPDVVPASAGNDQFSAERAAKHLTVIAAEPHSSGTPAHARVRDYIVDFCKQQGLETRIQEGTGLETFGNRARAGRAQNILVRLPGTARGKSIVVMSHYDSQPNTPGASDDGAGVAAMMEVMKMLKSEAPLKNDVIFLFTDLEESGLFGAELFVNQYKDLDKVGLLLNFESRGNSGVSMTFEVTSNNSWLMHEYAKAVGHAYANSLGYEVYKRMPNGTDFTRFRDTGIEGYNTAFIEGLTYYHSMADRVENMDLRSLQNHGDVLIRSLRHFGNLSLDMQHAAEDAIFFNPIGNWLWIYPIGWDIPLMGICLLLFIAVVILGVKRGRIKILKALAGAGMFLGFVITTLGLVWLMEYGVLALYPYYKNFDQFYAYNTTYYLISITGVVLLCFSVWYSKAVARPAFESFVLGGIFVLLIVMISLKIFLPTGAYLLHYPLIAVLLIYLILYLFNISAEERPLQYSLFQMVLLAPALSLWAPLVYLLFITFGHTMPLGPSGVVILFAPLLLPALRMIRSFNRWTVLGLSVILILTGFALGHIYSGYSKEKPLPVYLTYLLDADVNKASWISDQNIIDDWMKQFIHADAREEFEWYRGYKWTMWRGDASAMSADVGTVKVLEDTAHTNSRFLKLLITGDTATITLDFTLSPKTFVLKVNDRALPDSITRLSFWSIPSTGIEVELQGPLGTPINLSIIERKMGLPESMIKKPLPENMIHGQGSFANTSQTRRMVTL